MKIFTMVKGEADIVKDWVLYNGNIFGFNNLYIIDNYSLDGTFQILLNLKQKYNINIIRLEDYKKKGQYMTKLMKSFCINDFGFPIDIDEFIVLYDKKTNKISCDKNSILNYIKSLPQLPFYKMNYIISKILNDNGYSRATIEATHGEYNDVGSGAKTFFNTRLFKGEIDHGNHYRTNKYLLTKLCLVHFHERNLQQMKKKIYNNVKGLGYSPFNIINLENLAKNPQTMGIHHIRNQINILKNNYKITKNTINNGDISLAPLNNFFNYINS
jgi:hypothetical protein